MCVFKQEGTLGVNIRVLLAHTVGIPSLNNVFNKNVHTTWSCRASTESNNLSATISR